MSPHPENEPTPVWARGFSHDLRAFLKEAAADRRAAAEDRRRFAADSALRHKEFLGALQVIARSATLIIHEQKNQTKLLHDIGRTLRIAGNGHGRNGHGRHSS